MQWHNATDPAFHVSGLPWWEENERQFIRLPLRAREQVRPDIWRLAQMPSGARVRFRSNTTSLAVRVAHGGVVQMWNMAATGHSGIDLYVGESGSEVYWTTSMPSTTESAYESILFEDLTPEEREFTLYLPTYNSLVGLEIGLSASASLSPPTPFALAKPVVFYGSSITQSGCATRPGNGYVPMLGRQLNLNVVNQGYSGNGLGEPEVAQFLAEIDPACFVLDFHVNVPTVEGLREVYLPFYRTLRAAHPDTPILMVSMLEQPKERFLPAIREKRLGQTRVIRDAFETAIQEGDRNVTFCNGAWLIDNTCEGAFVDSLHPNDLGFANMAERLAPILRSILF